MSRAKQKEHAKQQQAEALGDDAAYEALIAEMESRNDLGLDLKALEEVTCLLLLCVF